MAAGPSSKALDRTPWVQPPLGFDVGGVSFFGGVKVSEGLAFAVDSYPRLIAASLGVNASSNHPTCAVDWGGAHVLHVLAFRHIPQITEPVVTFDAVDMVDVASWPSAVSVQPCQSMGVMLTSVDPNTDVADGVTGPGLISCLNPETGSDTPNKDASFWGIVQKFAQTLRSKINLSHEALLKLIGQKPAGVSALGGLRYFNS